MTICPSDAWTVGRVLINQPLNGELDLLPEPLKQMCEYLVGQAPEARSALFQAMLAARPERDELCKAVADVDPLGPSPPRVVRQYATAADLRQSAGAEPWRWQGWIPSDRIVGVAAEEGRGKTRFLLDLCRRVWLNLVWPDGQRMTLPPQTPSLWICSDGQHDEIAEMLPQFGLPLEAVVFPADPANPYDHVSLDSRETWDWITDAVAAIRPWSLVVDSLTYATELDLCEQRSIARLKNPLVELTQTQHLNVLLSLHVSKEGQALGRRIRGITRTLMHLECPDPDQSQRLRLWVEKSYGRKPAPLGVMIEASGNTYDTSPPSAPGSRNAALSPRSWWSACNGWPHSYTLRGQE